jgi:hypothetical protein
VQLAEVTTVIQPQGADVLPDPLALPEPDPLSDAELSEELLSEEHSEAGSRMNVLAKIPIRGDSPIDA